MIGITVDEAEALQRLALVAGRCECACGSPSAPRCAWAAGNSVCIPLQAERIMKDLYGKVRG